MSKMIISDEVRGEHRCYSINDVKRNYRFLLLYKELAERFSFELPDSDEGIISAKKGIRLYWKNEKLKTKRKIICGDIDGYLEKIEVPEDIKTKKIAKAWFRGNEYRERRPSQYDCTGQSFTNWYKVVRLHGKLYIYHSIGFDV